MKKIFALFAAAFSTIDIWGVLFPAHPAIERIKDFVPQWAIVPGLLLLFCALYFKPTRRQLSIGGVKNFLELGISWNSDFFIGVMVRQDESDKNQFRVTTSSIHAGGFNNTRHPLLHAKARLLLSDGSEVPLQVTTSEGSMDAASDVTVAPLTNFYIGATFKEGMPYKEFSEAYLPATLTFEWLGGDATLITTEKSFDKLVKRQLAYTQRIPKDKFGS